MDFVPPLTRALLPENISFEEFFSLVDKDENNCFWG